ncbi:MAG: amidohydrolase [Rhodospirillales bacterium]|nr:amidohydrolase [Rhodospirillales bacterium]
MFDRNEEIGDTLRSAGVVDTHYHVGPELVVRRYDVKTLADVAAPFGATLVLKNHTYPTTPLAALARSRFGADFYGGVVLNRFVGGLNPQAVEGAVSGNRAKVDDAAPDTSPIVVWMPTVHAVSHIETHGFGFDPRWSGCCTHGREAAAAGERTPAEPEHPVVAFDDSGRPVRALVETLEAIAKHDCILATGHLAAAEVRRLVPMAVDIGIRRVILTHPHYPAVKLSDDDLTELIRFPEVFVEHCFAIHTQDEVPLQAFADSIRATGPEQVLLSTDFGQVNSDPFPQGTIRYAAELSVLLGDYVSQDDFVAMFCANGRRVLGR